MTKEEFVNAIRQVVVDGSIKSIESNLVSPPGRSPQRKYVLQSQWYNRLSPENKEKILEVIREAVETSVFGFLCVLDGVRAIENNEDKGRLILSYKKNERETLLNDQSEHYLHDLL